MKITVFTSNQPRHISLINKLASVCEKVYAVMECNTVFPGVVQDFYKKTITMQSYFSNVIQAERKFFGDVSFTNSRVNVLAIKSGDLNLLNYSQLESALNSDAYIVFGSSYIKGWLIDFLVRERALNIHMGLSPYYRGSSCNFWALYDNNPHLVGATIHYLSSGLDSGPILYHVKPIFIGENGFEFTMKAVMAAHNSLINRVATQEIFKFTSVAQDRSLELRYTKNIDFTDEVARSYLDRNFGCDQLGQLLKSKEKIQLLNLYSE